MMILVNRFWNCQMVKFMLLVPPKAMVPDKKMYML